MTRLTDRHWSILCEQSRELEHLISLGYWLGLDFEEARVAQILDGNPGTLDGVGDDYPGVHTVYTFKREWVDARSREGVTTHLGGVRSGFRSIGEVAREVPIHAALWAYGGHVIGARLNRYLAESDSRGPIGHKVYSDEEIASARVMIGATTFAGFYERCETGVCVGLCNESAFDHKLAEAVEALRKSEPDFWPDSITWADLRENRHARWCEEFGEEKADRWIYGGAPGHDVLLERWRSDMRDRLRYSDVHVRKSVQQVRAFLDFCGDDEPTRKHALEWLASSSDLAAKTVRNRRGAIKAWGDWLVDRGDYDSNPFTNIRTAKATRSRGAAPFTIEEVRAIIAAAERAEAKNDKRVRKYGPLRSTLYAFMTETGLRFSECRRQEWRDIDLEGKTLAVTRDKAGRRDTLPLSAHCAALLESWREWSPGPMLFPTMPSHHTLAKDMRAAGLDPTAPGQWHRFRKAAITERAKRGAPLRELHKYARHADASMTAQSYDFAEVDELRESAELLPDLLGRLKKSPEKSSGEGHKKPKSGETAPRGSESDDPEPRRTPPQQWSRGDSTHGPDPEADRVRDFISLLRDLVLGGDSARKREKHDQRDVPPEGRRGDLPRDQDYPGPAGRDRDRGRGDRRGAPILGPGEPPHVSDRGRGVPTFREWPGTRPQGREAQGPPTRSRRRRRPRHR